MKAGDFRFRTRITPYKGQLKTPGYQDPVVKAGKWELKSVDTGKWVPMGDTLVQVQNPHLRAESCYDQIHAGPPYRSGGPFTKIMIEFPPNQVLGSGIYTSQLTTRAIWGVGTGPLRYTGGFTNPVFQGDTTSYASIAALLGFASPLIPSTASLESLAFAKTRPPMERAGLAVAVAELRDLPRMLGASASVFHKAWKTSFDQGIFTKSFLADKARNLPYMAPKESANHFLNHNFGWVPFLSDLEKLGRAFRDSAAIKGRMSSENNKWITRRAILVNNVQETKLAGDFGMRVEPAGDYVNTLFFADPYWEVWERKATLVTTSGSFKYYRPEFDRTLPDYDSAWNTIQREMSLYGARISPSNIYKAVPWTWLIDWFTDFGSVVDRFNDIALDGIVSKYLYLMRHDFREVVLKQTLPFKDGGTQIIEFSRVTDVKIRRESGSPYGFGLSWGSLSPKQLAILAALGVSRKS